MKPTDRERLQLACQSGIIHLVDVPANEQIKLHGLHLVKGDVSLALWQGINIPLHFQVRRSIIAELKEKNERF